MAADRDLLFGLLALQNGLIDQAQLVGAFQGWTRGRDRPLADFLAERGDLDAEGRAVVEAMVALHVKKHGGDPATSVAAVPVGRSIRKRLAALGDPELTGSIAIANDGPPDPEDDPERTTNYAEGPSSADGRRFRVLRPHATGGLGAVFVALDDELHREVALKQILDHHADDSTSRTRFVLEAEITGGLEHPGIVPVYGMGTYADGRPYYAMRFIRGDSLKEAIAAFHASGDRREDAGRRSLELRKLLRRFLDVCNAIDYAHGRGVLHRDIKPSNVIVGRHGETLVVDWGLAKAQGKSDAAEPTEERPLTVSSASGSAETLPGSALGTPAYMSPEQARGDLEALGPASDVYSLGATLYSLLTGRPAFEGDIGDVLRAVQKGEFPPPRRLASEIDPALEAICLKAMALKPQDRYPSAKALAEDIERWVADEPVTAWREPIRRRLTRWQNRHPSLVYGGAATLLVMVVGLAVTNVATRRQRDITEAAREATRAKAVEAESGFLWAAQSISYLSQLADQRLTREPRLLPLRREMTAEAAIRFEQFLPYRPDDSILLDNAAKANRNYGIVLVLLGDFARAREAYLRAIELREKSNRLSPGPLGQLTLSEAYLDTARMFADFGRQDEAAGYLAKDRKLIDAILAEPAPSTKQARDYMVPTTHNHSGRCATKEGDDRKLRGDLDGARAAYRRAVDDLTRGLEDKNHWYWYDLFRAQAHRGLALVARESGRKDEAEREFAEALKISRAATAARTDDPDPPYVTASVLGQYASALSSDPARAVAAEAMLDEALALIDATLAQDPARQEPALDRSEFLLARANVRVKVRGDVAASLDLEDARKVLTGLSAPGRRDDLALAGRLGRVELALGQIRLRQGRKDEGRELIHSARAHLERAVRDRPGIVIEQTSLEEARRASLEGLGAAY